MKKVILTDTLLLEENKETLEKKLGCKFIRINTSKKGYNADYEASRVQTFISNFKNKELKKLEKESNKKIKELEDEIKNLKLELTSQTTQ